MRPEGWRRWGGFVALAAAATFGFPTPALAQGETPSQWPLTLALGAASLAILTVLVMRTLMAQERQTRRRALDQVAQLRVLADQYEALLSSARELTVIWPEATGKPRLLGQLGIVLPRGRLRESVLNFGLWLGETDAGRLGGAIEALKNDGRAFELALTTRDGRGILAGGLAVGGATALRLRPAVEPAQALPAPATEPLRTILDIVPAPAFLRDQANRLIHVNAAYLDLMARTGKAGTASRPAEVLDPETLRQHLTGGRTINATIGQAGMFALLTIPLGEGRAGILRPVQTALPAPQPVRAAQANQHLAVVIDALSVPVALFDARRELVQFNRAYAALWELEGWLRPGLEERAILDRLRTDGKLPDEADYHAWRARHLNTSYSLTRPRESAWHLPDGRTVNVIAAPASAEGGVIYVFDDITRSLELESRNRALLDVQRSTLNSLSEAVAVFGTNGRLTLSNPRLSAIWKLPMNELGQNPHIDRIAAACARALPEDGADIWRMLKRSIIDLNPGRTDISGRITRSDGRLIDYAIVRLPDGQSMMTFLDVTESAKYSQVLKERNEALVAAGRLKDAFVQNVSYELRSPLTNIIGFADLLASPAVGTLNERQRAYTDYIRASSQTLGLLIDNILDLATVDAGIAELKIEPLDARELVEKARAGLAATFPKIDGQEPLDLIVDVPEHLPPLMADATRIVQVLYNLMSSAARFSEPGAPVRLSVRSRGDALQFIVEDEGTMSEDVRAALLGTTPEPEFVGRQRGAGLGLAIVQAFVRLHYGTISVETREPRGNRVVVSLPLRLAVAGAAE